MSNFGENKKSFPDIFYFVKGLFAKLKVLHLFQKLRYWYQTSPKKAKVYISIIALSFVLSVLFVVLRLQGQNKLPLPPFITTNSNDLDSGVWQKMMISEKSEPFFNLNPNLEDERIYGIVPSAKFVLRTQKPVDIGFINEHISTSVPVNVVPVKDTEFELIPKRKLLPSEVITFSFNLKDKEKDGYYFDRNYGWAYQAQPKFAVNSTLPKDKTRDFPLNSGIEITFNLDDYEDPISYLTVNPKIDFRLERRGSVLSIVPLKKLSPRTVYTVTLKKGLKVVNGVDSLDKDLIFSFQTADEIANDYRFYLKENLQQVIPEGDVISGVYLENWDNDQNIKFEIYKLPNANVFVNSRKQIDKIEDWWRYFPEQYNINTKDFTKISEGETKIEKIDDVNYVKVPSKLSEGFYLVKFYYDNNKKLEQLWLQVTPLMGYVSVAKENTLFWLNSVDGSPIASASVSVMNSSISYSTNEEGIALFATPKSFFEGDKKYFEITNRDNKKLILPVGSLNDLEKPGKLTKDDYWSYIYTDRYMYKPSDTLYFWGVAKNRNTNSSVSEVEVKLTSSYDYDSNFYGYNKVEAIRKISTSSNGSFIGSFKIDDLTNRHYELLVFVDGIVIARSVVLIEEYVKPELKIEVSSNKKAVFAGEEVEFSGRVSFFDGTAASYVPLSVIKGSNIIAKLETGRDGEFVYKYVTSYSENKYYPSYETLEISLDKSEFAGIYQNVAVLVYGSRFKVESKANLDGGNARIKATVFNIDLGPFNEGVTSEVKSGVVGGQKVVVRSKRTWYERIEDGTYYDFVEKVTRTKYKYSTHQEDFPDKELLTNNDGQIDYQVPLSKGSSYTFEIIAKDKDGRSPISREYLYYYDEIDVDNESFSSPYLKLEKGFNAFSVGENVDIKIYKDNKNYPDNEKNKFLFIKANRGNLSFSLKDEPSFGFVFEESHKPNIYVGAIVFTGKIYEEVEASCDRSWICDYYYSSYRYKADFNGLQIFYQTKDSELDFDIKTGKSKYAPGEQAKVTVKVSKNGQPRDGVTVALALVDEAVAAIGGANEPSIEKSIYRTTGDWVYYTYYTHRFLLPDGHMAEGGGGGNDRSEFGDTAYFGSAVTDQNGEAVFEFKLLDNITNWLIYAQGVDSDLNFGQEKASVIATKEFFVTNQFPSTIIKGDKAYLAINAYGKVLEKNKKVSYNYAFLDQSGEKAINKKEFSEFPFRDIHIPFPSLEVGNYKVKAGGKYKEYEDSIMLPLIVKSSRVMFEKRNDISLDQGQSISSLPIDELAKEENIKLVITDQGKGKFYNALYKYCNSYSNRIEKKLANVLADKSLRNWFNETDCKTANQEFSGFQSNDGGIKQVLWGSSDVETSAWSAYIGADFFDKERLKKYFNDVLENSTFPNISKAYALWGLAVLGESRVNEMRNLEKKLFSYREKVILAYAFAASGQTEKARDLYYDLLAEFAYANKPYIRIQSGQKNMDSYLLDSSYALLLGSIVDQKYNTGLGLYLRDYRTLTKDVVLDLADISFIDHQISLLTNEDTSISLKIKDKHKKLKLNKGRGEVLAIKKDDAGKFELKVETGKVLVSINSYVENMDGLETDKRLRLSRSYSQAVGDSDEKISIGEIAEFKLDFSFNREFAPAGIYCITDHIPSGFTYLENPSFFSIASVDKIFMQQIRPNVVRACVSNSHWFSERQYKAVYYAKASAVGEYVLEPAFMQHEEEKSIFQKTDKSTIKVDAKI
ncbi:MAG: Ig-like domain-containing protein [Patescibacteria group bacterium]|nr:Ig-like domain-containing protein [Patescibacteria group bacterium]